MANGVILGDGKIYFKSSDLTDNYIDFNNDVANVMRLYNQDGEIHITTNSTSYIKLMRSTFPLLVAGSGINNYVGLGINTPERAFHVHAGTSTTSAVTYVNKFTN